MSLFTKHCLHHRPLNPKDIAFEFGMWISAEFKIYLIKEFQRLKEDENNRLKLGWNLQRTLAKINYRIHTDAIKVRNKGIKKWKECCCAIHT